MECPLSRLPRLGCQVAEIPPVNRGVPLSERAQAILAGRLPFTVREHQLRYAWEKAKLAMGLSGERDFVFHALRHTRATRLVQMGVNLRIVQHFLGHQVMQTTMRYAHVSDDILAQTATDPALPVFVRHSRSHLPSS